MRVCRQIAIVAVGAIAVGTAAIPSATAAGSPKHDPTAGIGSMLSKMTLEQKVGQLFVTYAYGDTATTTDPAYTAQNQALYGVDNGAELVSKYHLGGVIYFTWAGNLANPTQIATLSNGLQTSAA